MRLAARPISDLRLTRLHRWAMLWLTWFAAFLDAAANVAPLAKQARGVAHRWLDTIERLIVAIVVIRAARGIRSAATHAPFRTHRRKGHGRRRAVVGCAMRRTLRRRDLSARIAALRTGMSKLIAHVLKRLPRGLTRRRPICARPEVNAALLASALVARSAPTAGDTS